MTRRRRFRLVVTTRLGSRWLVKRRDSGFTLRGGGRITMTAGEVERAKKWAKRRRVRSLRVLEPGEWAFLSKADTAWPTQRRLLVKLNKVGRRTHRRVHIISGLRTPREAWVLRMRYLNGHGNLAARCCLTYSGVHTWAACGKQPQSNHADGRAADVGVITRSGGYLSLGLWRRSRKATYRVGLTFPILRRLGSPVDEWWHVETA